MAEHKLPPPDEPRERYSFDSQLEFLRGRIKTEKKKNDEDTQALVCMYNSLIASVQSARHVFESKGTIVNLSRD